MNISIADYRTKLKEAEERGMLQGGYFQIRSYLDQYLKDATGIIQNQDELREFKIELISTLGSKFESAYQAEQESHHKEK